MVCDDKHCLCRLDHGFVGHTRVDIVLCYYSTHMDLYCSDVIITIGADPEC